MLVDPATGQLTAVAGRALRAHEQDGRDDAPLEAELFLQQIESQTQPTTDVSEIAAQLRSSRRVMGKAARAAGAAAVATGTAVLVDGDSQVTPKPRYPGSSRPTASWPGPRSPAPCTSTSTSPTRRRASGPRRDRPVAAGAARPQRQLAVRPRP